MTEKAPPQTFTESQLTEMTLVKDPKSGHRISLKRTPKLELAYIDWLETGCDHETCGIRRVPIKGGKHYICNQCLTCGERMGNWLPKKDFPNVSEIAIAGEMTPNKFWRVRWEKWEATKQGFLAKSDRVLSEEYTKYLGSSEWKALRQKVFQRSNGICEGCADRKATQVHHLTYKHIFNEFLWELAAICDECHDRVHAESEDDDPDEEPEITEDELGEPDDIPFDFED